jgi:hypothetical protein
MTQTVTEFFRAKKERSDAEVKAANWSARKSAVAQRYLSPVR